MECLVLSESDLRDSNVGGVHAYLSMHELCWPQRPPFPRTKGTGRWKGLKSVIVPGPLQTMQTYLAEVIFKHTYFHEANPVCNSRISLEAFCFQQS